MAESAILKYEVRELSKPEKKRFLSEGYVLGVIFGKGIDSIPIAVKKSDFQTVVKEYGRNAVIKMEGPDNAEYNVMVRDVELTPLTYEFHHVDFQHVSLTEVMEADVLVRFVGTDYLDTKGLIVNRQMDSIAINALPHNIPDFIDIDVSQSQEGDTILIKDLKLDSGVTTNLDDDELVATINTPRMDTEEEGDVETDVEVGVVGEENSETETE